MAATSRTSPIVRTNPPISPATPTYPRYLTYLLTYVRYLGSGGAVEFGVVALKSGAGSRRVPDGCLSLVHRLFPLETICITGLVGCLEELGKGPQLGNGAGKCIKAVQPV